MLQQTTVAAVIPYFERFLRRFPDVKSLARAPEQDVLREWAGLGYYSRARNLHKAAQKIVEAHGGIFPGTFDEVLDLPGIGRYTAGAVLSIAFQKPYPVLDGNVMRVFARLYGIRQNVKDAATTKRLWALSEKLLERTRPGDWNQALMELGATVCLPDSPLCGKCPVSPHCEAFKKNLQDKLPLTGKQPDFLPLKWHCLWIENKGKVLLWKRSSDEKLLKGLWGLPERRHLKEARVGKTLKVVGHAITRYKLTVEVKSAALEGPLPSSGEWVARAKLKDYLVSSLWLKCLP